MSASRSDAVAVLGMAKIMFKEVEDICNASNFDELSKALLRLSEQQLCKTDDAYPAQQALQLRIRSFIKNHNIKE